ncbi:anti-sigma factor, partial [Candidatus Gracilibacteria bacterium]|nr:anti-sigma factor [Candidatus Gracilibacteria bacterium]
APPSWCRRNRRPSCPRRRLADDRDRAADGPDGRRRLAEQSHLWRQGAEPDHRGGGRAQELRRAARCRVRRRTVRRPRTRTGRAGCATTSASSTIRGSTPPCWRAYSASAQGNRAAHARAPGFTAVALLAPAAGDGAGTTARIRLGQQYQLRQQEEQIAQQRAQSTRNVALVLAAFGNEDAVEGTLTATDAAPGASGRYFLSPGEPALALYVKGLPAAATGSEYQVWVVVGGETVSANTFAVNAEGRAWRLAAPPITADTIERIFVTLEPVGGSTQPSGPIVLQ